MSNVSKGGVVNVLQINLQHSKKGTASLQGTLGKIKTCICLIQEPYFLKGKIRGLSNLGNMFCYGEGEATPRSCIVTTRDVKSSPLLPFCSKDVVAIETSFKHGTVVFASVYMAYDGIIPPVQMKELVSHCQDRGLPLILGCDSNAHHELWGSTNTNQRGEVLCEYILSQDLHCVNRGAKPTFVVSNRREVIDITLVSNSILPKVTHWWVDDSESSSDHRYIRTKIRLGPPEPILCRNRRKTNWTLFKDSVIPELQKLDNGQIESVEQIDQKVNVLTSILGMGFDQACPERLVKLRNKKVPWWTKELTSLRKETRRLYRVTVMEGSYSSWVAYCDTRNRYNSAVRREKKISWRKYCEEIEAFPEASRLYRILKDDKGTELGSIKKDDGTFTKTVPESIEFLMEKHFPADPSSGSWEEDHEQWVTSSADTVVNLKQVERAVDSFGPYKAPGADGVFPAMLQAVKREIAPYLVSVMRACLIFGYTPKKWREMRVVFLPKPGKDTYQRANAWRPISLTSFLLKTLERMIDWHIREPKLIGNLRANNQFAYMRGVSTEAAMHQIVARAERTLKSGEYAIGVFLDIKGAFSEATFKSLVAGMERHGIDPLCVRFISHMLRNRTVSSNYQSFKVSRVLERGCPQGGVLSPLLWNLVMDEGLARVNAAYPQVYSQSFADDIAMLSRGPDLSTVTDHAQRSLNVIAKWSREISLDIEGDKTVVLLFTRKRKRACKQLKLFGIPLEYKTQVKYLGVNIDNMLNWGPHCSNRAARGMVALARCKRALGATWGLRPKVMLWLYTAVIRPAVEYGALVWVPASNVKSHMSKLCRVQRAALVATAGVMQSTPTAALEALFGLLPIELRLQQVALQTMHRLSANKQWLGWYNVGHTGQVTHQDLCEKLSREIPVFYFPCDNGKCPISSDRAFQVQIRSRSDWSKYGLPNWNRGDWICFTDGSRIHGQSGAAYYIMNSSLPEGHVEGIIPLGLYPTVFQAEELAVLELGRCLLDNCPKQSSVRIYVDSQAALRSLTRDGTVWGLTKEVVEVLNELGQDRDVTLNWIPSHSGFEGNERVDGLAKMGAERQPFGPQPILPISVSVVKLAIRDWARNLHALQWKRTPQCRHTKIFVKEPYKRNLTDILNLPRGQLRQLVQTITGHNTLNRHLNVIGLSSSPLCPCGEGEETGCHFLGDCVKYLELRYKVLGGHLLKPEDLGNASLVRLAQFIAKSGRYNSDHGGSRSAQ